MAEVAYHGPQRFDLGASRGFTTTTSGFQDSQLNGGRPGQNDMFLEQRQTTLPSAESSSSQAIPSSTGVASRRHVRAPNSLNALPVFSFNPSVSSTTSLDVPLAGAPLAASAPTTPARASRHRRTASELITPLSVSPNTRYHDRSMHPVQPVFGSLPSRLEGRYQRTDTLTSERISPTEDSIPSSTVTEDDGVKNPNFITPQPSPTRNHTLTGTQNRQHSLRAGPRAPRSPVRLRVGFADQVEFIPRPLSTISSESGSSASTIRAHSISGSISSVMASGTASPLGKAMSPTRRSFDSASSPLRASFDPFETFRHSPQLESSSQTQVPAITSSTTPSTILPYKQDITSGLSDKPAGPTPAMIERNPGEPQPATLSDTIKPRKNHPWTSFLPLKAKSTTSRQEAGVLRMDSSSPPRTKQGEEADTFDGFELSEDFDADPTSMIVTDTAMVERATTNTPPLTPNEGNLFHLSSADETQATMIDLDELMASEPAQEPRIGKGRSFANRRNMHINTGAGGLYSHRRSDSAPSPTSLGFDSASFRERNSSLTSFRRSKMEDVFEEDEETMDRNTALGTAQADNRIATTSAFPMTMSSTQSLKSTDGDIGTTQAVIGPRRLRFVPSPPILRSHSNDFMPYNDRADVSDYSRSPRPSSDMCSVSISDRTSLKTAPSIDGEVFPIRNQVFASDTPRTSSPLSASHCGCGKDCSNAVSKDTMAPLPIHGRRIYAQSLVDRGYSVDDVPSLISSQSTAPSGSHPRISHTSHNGRVPRSVSSSVSLSSALEKQRKRSSIASFSRFVGFPERKRESQDPGSRWHNPIQANETKVPKSSRLSRLLRFWKPSKAHETKA